MKSALIAATAALLASPALAGDATVGEKEFNKCKTCHAIVAPDGTEVVKGGKTGPNLWGVIGRTAGTQPDFTGYGDDLLAAGAAGAVWDEAALAAYVTDPTAWLKETTGSASARSKMTFKLKSKQEDIAAFLALQR
ncbi:MAG: cytochrome C [Cypionkella sp.]|nr:cytochrome C [Cypionkella sp.]